MKYVEPLKNKDDIKKISNYFKEQHKRNYLLFTLGINTPMRVTQLLNNNNDRKKSDIIPFR